MQAVPMHPIPPTAMSKIECLSGCGQKSPDRWKIYIWHIGTTRFVYENLQTILGCERKPSGHWKINEQVTELWHQSHQLFENILCYTKPLFVTIVLSLDSINKKIVSLIKETKPNT